MAVDIVSLLTKGLSKAQLKEIDTRIEALQGEIADRQKELAALNEAKKVDDIRKNGRPKRGGGTRRSANGNGNGHGDLGIMDRDSQVHSWLKKNGPAKPAAIAVGMDIPSGSITAIVNRLENAAMVVRQADGIKAI